MSVEFGEPYHYIPNISGVPRGFDRRNNINNQCSLVYAQNHHCNMHQTVTKYTKIYDANLKISTRGKNSIKSH